MENELRVEPSSPSFFAEPWSVNGPNKIYLEKARTELLQLHEAFVHPPPQLRPLGKLILRAGL